MNILGISGLYHDSAACLLIDDNIVAAASEERFTRRKNDPAFPGSAIEFCLGEGNIRAKELDAVVFYEEPLRKLDRIILTHAGYFPKTLSSFIDRFPGFITNKLNVGKLVREYLFYEVPVHFIPHHLSHAASSFYISPFEDAAILTMDGIGEWATTTIATGHGNTITTLKEMHYPHSIGLLYSVFTDYLGFRVDEDEYKVMGLAPYGVPQHADLIFDTMVKRHSDASFALNLDYFAFQFGKKNFNDRFTKLFGIPRRNGEEPLAQAHKDIAASIQFVTEELILALVRHAIESTGMENLCLAGGVALNCVANGRIQRETSIKDIFINPAAGDAGGAMGAALHYNHAVLNRPRNRRFSPFLGPSFSDAQIEPLLKAAPLEYRRLDQADLLKAATIDIVDGKTIGWFQGRMEWGPRALGCRSILADARIKENKDIVNRKIKFRESFRPFAPACLDENAHDLFSIEKPLPYMQTTVFCKQPKLLPATTHVDGSSRVQTVCEEDNPLFHKLLSTFYRKTGCPAIINTSFNRNHEPIVCVPLDAINCFLNCGMDTLYIGSFHVAKRRIH